ncbi:MAG: hypothetical protein QOK05_2047 [Chloroflexota bacterium]|nr:hypothetical protein [Chloroflexota bacterium]
MAVDAARDCLTGMDRGTLDSVVLATTTAPFDDRLNAGIVAAALGLAETVAARDSTGTFRAGLSSVFSACDAAMATGATTLCVSTDARAAAAMTPLELGVGHAAASVVVGPGDGLARVLACQSLTIDLVDHYRSRDSEFDYGWEDRWIRDEGYMKIVPRLAMAALAEAGLQPGDIDHFCLPCQIARVPAAVARAVGIPESSIRDQLVSGCGDSGTAHPILMLVNALEDAKPGDRILVVAFGQGGCALIVEVTEAMVDYQLLGTGPAKWIRRAIPSPYPKYLALNGLLKVDPGKRAEADKSTALSALYRHRDLTMHLVGGVCGKCGFHQVPRQRICVNPECGALDSQVPHSFAESTGHVASWTADNLTYTPDPPAYYGMIDFEEGGRLIMDFTNIATGAVEVGTPMRMVYRIKDHDPLRHFDRYFWKAAPSPTTGEEN